MTYVQPATLHMCRELMASKARSFSLAARILPGHRAAAVIYAWCRRCDDAIDDATDDAAKNANLARLRRELHSIYEGRLPEDPVLAALHDVVQAYHVPLMYPAELLIGMEMDVVGTRYESLPQLLQYCYRVAGCVGLMMSHVMGIQDDRALRHAAHLGMAMQLTNICRDVVEDWRMGRIYIPCALLETAGTALEPQPGTLPPAPVAAALARGVEQLLSLAEQYYRSADEGLRFLDWRSAFAVSLARHYYAEIGRVLAARNYDVTCGRAVVSGSRKLVLFLICAIKMLKTLPARLSARIHIRQPSMGLPWNEALIDA